MYSFLLTCYLLIASSLVLIILLQKSPGIAIQAKSSFTGPRSRANILTRITGILAACFIGFCLLLTRINIKNYRDKQALIAEEKKQENKQAEIFPAANTTRINTDILTKSAEEIVKEAKDVDDNDDINQTKARAKTK